MLKRIGTILLTILMSVVFVAGCGNGQEPSNNNQKESKEVKTVTMASKLENVEITLGQQTFSAQIERNSDTEQVFDKLPMQVSMTPLSAGNFLYGGHFVPPTENFTKGFKKGDIALCHSNYIVVFFDDQPANHTGEYRKIGQVTSHLNELAVIKNGGKMTMTLAKQNDSIDEKADLVAIEHVYDDMYKYEVAKDIDKLGSLLKGDYVLVHMTGKRQNKAEYLNAVKVGDLNYFSYEKDSVKIDIKNATHAVLTGQTRVTAAVFGGSRHTWRLQLVIPMEKVEGKWLMQGDTVASMY